MFRKKVLKNWSLSKWLEEQVEMEVRDFGFEEVAFAIMKNLEIADRLGVEVRSVEFEINRSGREVHSAWAGHESREGNCPRRSLEIVELRRSQHSDWVVEDRKSLEADESCSNCRESAMSTTFVSSKAKEPLF